MREIKFKFWSGNKMFYNDDINTWECLRQQFCKDPKKIGYDHIKECGAAFLQYTGVKDKKGKEIYEGDLVKSKGEKSGWVFDLCVVSFENGIFIVKGFDGTEDEGQTDALFDDVTVIGNIYENKELLE